MDLAMPGVDGHEATRRLRQMPELGKAVIITSSANVAAAERLKDPEAGWDDFLPKPVQAQVLLEKIHRFLGVEWTRAQDSGAAPARTSASPWCRLRPRRSPRCHGWWPRGASATCWWRWSAWAKPIHGSPPGSSSSAFCARLPDAQAAGVPRGLYRGAEQRRSPALARLLWFVRSRAAARDHGCRGPSSSGGACAT